MGGRAWGEHAPRRPVRLPWLPRHRGGGKGGGRAAALAVARRGAAASRPPQRGADGGSAETRARVRTRSTGARQQEGVQGGCVAAHTLPVSNCAPPLSLTQGRTEWAPGTPMGDKFPTGRVRSTHPNIASAKNAAVAQWPMLFGSAVHTSPVAGGTSQGLEVQVGGRASTWGGPAATKSALRIISGPAADLPPSYRRSAAKPVNPPRYPPPPPRASIPVNHVYLSLESASLSKQQSAGSTKRRNIL